MCDHEELGSCYNSSHEVFFPSGKGRGVALVRVGMGKPIGCSASCFLSWFLQGTCSSVTCGSRSSRCNSPTCEGASPAGSAQELRLNSEKVWFLAAAGRTASGGVRLCDLVGEGEEQQPQGLVAEKPEDPGIPTNVFSQPVAATPCHKWRTYPQLFMVWL